MMKPDNSEIIQLLRCTENLIVLSNGISFVHIAYTRARPKDFVNIMIYEESRLMYTKEVFLNLTTFELSHLHIAFKIL